MSKQPKMGTFYCPKCWHSHNAQVMQASDTPACPKCNSPTKRVGCLRGCFSLIAFLVAGSFLVFSCMGTMDEMGIIAERGQDNGRAFITGRRDGAAQSGRKEKMPAVSDIETQAREKLRKNREGDHDYRPISDETIRAYIDGYQTGLKNLPLLPWLPKTPNQPRSENSPPQ